MNGQCSPEILLIPLRRWIEGEFKYQSSGQQTEGGGDEKQKKVLVLRKTTIAYGVAELIMYARDHYFSAAPSSLSISKHFNIDNFAVRFSDSYEAAAAAPGNLFQRACNDIKGLDMISPQISVNIVEPSFLSYSFSDADDDVEDQIIGRYLEVEFELTSLPDAVTTSVCSQSDEDAHCHALGVILYELFSNLSPSPMPHSAFPKVACCPLIELGYPASISMLVQNLLECGEVNRPYNAYDSLETLSKDLHLLLLDPNRFLFDQELSAKIGSKQLSFREHILYGREKEISLITDAFCRVSSGKSEALFIGGFSGAGKSRLVNSLTSRVDHAEGYVLTHKFDQISKERPLLEVISVFNNLCLLVREKRSSQELLVIVKNLVEVFGTDFSMLARLLPNIKAIYPGLIQTDHISESGDQMKLQNVCFILQRFMRVVSSTLHPVMLFLDDLQWCDNSRNSPLKLIEGILCDVGGSSCFFFVGSFRSNQVQDDHAIFHLIDNLSSFGVPTAKLSLEGLKPDDLNTMISDAMRIFPRICKPLSEIVFQKTKGNPFFVLEFLRSLVDGSFLEYSAKKRRWHWDLDRIRAMDVADNVLDLLSRKMSGLSENVQKSLAVAACFGMKIKESVVNYLSADPGFSNIQSGLEHVIAEGFMIKVGTSDFKFVHDKVREAAYGLIPQNEKRLYHYQLGMSLYSISKGRDVDDIIFSIADQINLGMYDSLVHNPELGLDLAKLNEMAGVKAACSSDYPTARSYLDIALALLPKNRWESHYDLTLRLHFLLAKSAHWCGDMEKACDVSQKILEGCRHTEDKIKAYHRLVLILHDRGDILEAYTTLYEVLSQLGESIPDAPGPQETKKMVKITSEMLNGISEESLLGMKEMDRKSQFVLQFYNSMTVVAFVCKKQAMVPFYTCRMVQLTLASKTISKYSLIGFVQCVAMSCHENSITVIQEACRIAKLAMSVLKRFDASAEIVPRVCFIYYSLVASYSETLPSCADGLLRGFECGMASGDTSSAFLCAIHHIRLSLLAGTALPDLLKRVEYFLGLVKSHRNQLAKNFLSLHKDTVLTLMGKGCDDSEVQVKAMNIPAALQHKALQSFWTGHPERCHHFYEKLFGGGVSFFTNQFRFNMLYYGLNSFKITKPTSSKKMKAIPFHALEELKTSASCSRVNFCNKVHLLEAEIFSHEGNHKEAKVKYAAAVSSARCSGMIHEQGLACEHAGFHYKKIGDNRRACCFFDQANQCYAEWGSQMKVDHITRELEYFQVGSRRCVS